MHLLYSIRLFHILIPTFQMSTATKKQYILLRKISTLLNSVRGSYSKVQNHIDSYLINTDCCTDLYPVWLGDPYFVLLLFCYQYLHNEVLLDRGFYFKLFSLLHPPQPPSTPPIRTTNPDFRVNSEMFWWTYEMPGSSFIYFDLFKIDKGEGGFMDTLYVYTQNT